PEPTQAPTEAPTTKPTPTIPPAKEVCKEAKADLAFLVDGSWSIGDDNFMKITRFLYSTMGSLDLIGPDGTQVYLFPVSWPQFTGPPTALKTQSINLHNFPRQ
ncbi:hypothetical protein XENOCAPTIV_012721, partial [Xenoophorus captivus]